jgi:twitching motility protein PilT
VFGTLHTTSAISTIDRIIDVFPTDAQQQVRVQLASTLQGVISQTLVAKVGGGRVAAREILVATDAVRSLIREAKSPQILNLMQTGKQYGMVTLEDDLLRFCAEGLIQGDDAVAKANRPDDVRKRLGQAPARPAPAGNGMGGNGMGSMFGNGAASAARTPNARMPGPIGVRR